MFYNVMINICTIASNVARTTLLAVYLLVRKGKCITEIVVSVLHTLNQMNLLNVCEKYSVKESNNVQDTMKVQCNSFYLCKSNGGIIVLTL